MRGPLALVLVFSLAAPGCARRRANAQPSPPPSDAAFQGRYRPPTYGPSMPPSTVSRFSFGPASTQTCTVDTDCGPTSLCFNTALDAQYSSVVRDCPDAQAWRARRVLGRCLQPGCRSDEECAQGTRCADIQMLPFPERTCVPAGCRSDFDCRRQRGGRCVQYVAGARCEPGGWHCSYPSDACAPHDLTRPCAAPRGSIGYCVPRDGRFRCVVETSPSP